MITVDYLRRLKIYSETPMARLEQLAQAMERRHFEAGEIVCQEGDPGDSLYILAEGAVSVRKKRSGSDSELMVVARFKPEEFFGEMSFLDRAPHSATVVADEPSEVLLLPRKTIEDFIKSDPVAGLERVLTMFRGVGARLRQTTNALVTVFEVAQIISQLSSLEQMMVKIFRSLKSSVGTSSGVAFYRWNPFNEEFNLVTEESGPLPRFPLAIESSTPLLKAVSGSSALWDDVSDRKASLIPVEMTHGSLVIARCLNEGKTEGLLLAANETPAFFTNDVKHLIETIAGVLAPALVSVRAREEDAARVRLEQTRQGSTL